MRKNIILLAALPLLASCVSPIYHAQSVDVPLINHKGDVRVSADMSLSAWLLPDAMNLNATGTVGITDWLAGQVHANYGGDNAYMHAAPGVYFPLSDKLVVEGYAGFGYGAIWRNGNKNKDEAEGSGSKNSHTYSGRFMLPFGQVNIGWHDLGPVHFGIALGMKVGGYMPDFEAREASTSGTTTTYRYYAYHTTNLLLEPQVQVTLGGENVKWVTRLGFSWMSDLGDGKSQSDTFINDWLTIGTGLQLSF